MDCSWAEEALAGNLFSTNSLTQEQLKILRTAPNEQFLTALARLALEQPFTRPILAIYEPLLPEICARWRNFRTDDDTPSKVLNAYAAILPHAPYVASFAIEYLFHDQIHSLRPEQFELNLFRKDRQESLLPSDKSHRLQPVLLSLYRLLAFDIDAFRDLVSVPQLVEATKLMGPVERYLVTRILKLLLDASDLSEAAIRKAWLDDEQLAGLWEDRTIDYRFLDLWETKIYTADEEGLQAARVARQSRRGPQRRLILSSDLSPGVVEIAGRLLPYVSSDDSKVRDQAGDMVPTTTTLFNLGAIADGLLETQPLLLFGAPGCGKTSLILHIASLLRRRSGLVTLHLNAQTDAKLLVGLYISDVETGSFKWQPGVLTTAVTEGRWVLVEDIDKAPVEVLSVFLPLIETNSLTIPSTGRVIKAAPGFRVISTARGFHDRAGNVKDSTSSILGIRLWNKITIRDLPKAEVREIIDSRYPRLTRLVPDIWKTYRSILQIYSTPEIAASAKAISMRDLMKWCSRIDTLAKAAGSKAGTEALPDSFFDYTYQEAIDCFAASLPSENSRRTVAKDIAWSLQMSPEKQVFYESQHLPRYESDPKSLKVGRVSLRKAGGVGPAGLLGRGVASRPFANTRHALRLMESVASAIREGEPTLLVGETGTGKTTVVQKLAETLGRSLTVVNLSQQSEAGDLLGGYKPVNIRTLAMPLKQEFDSLFGLSFSAKRNQKFIDAVTKYSAKQQWLKVVKLWREAVKMVADGALTALGGGDGKRRRLDPTVIDNLRARWIRFAEEIETFSIQLGNTSQKFAFSFVEGSIVKAVRNGDWVLLDEINLAAPDTLEALADLFQSSKHGSPSILLSEKGDIQQVLAHQEFRVFAAMNPATDVGKKDLPPGIRSRFTEIYVDTPDKKLDALVPVISVYLGSHCTHDDSIAHDIARLYLEAKSLADTNQLVDGASQKPHFSLRTLTRTLSYVVDIAPMFGLRRAVYEGFCMSFLTLLDKQSESLLLPILHKHIFQSEARSKSLLRQIARRPDDGERYVEFKHYWIKQGNEPIEAQPHYIITPFVEKNMLNLVRASSTRRFPILIQGPTSSGKTSMIEYLAKTSGNKFVRINNHEHTDLQEYLGSYVSGTDGQLRFEDGVLVRALREGHWVVLDELNLAPTDILEALNRLLDDNRELLVPETQEVVRPHPNFVLFATQNPPGLYGGRKYLSRAFRNRFLELHFDDIPETELETILRERTQIAPSFCSRIVAVYKELSILRQSSRLFEQKNSFATLRDLFRWALRDADDREQLAKDGFMLLAERVRNVEERQAVKAVIERVMKTKINEDELYESATTNNDTHANFSQQIIMTKAMKRLYTLVRKAIDKNEPVLLIGETGCGKTSICQMLAQASDKQLLIVNAHQNMETGDLIGAQRPIRNRAALEVHLRSLLLEALASKPQDAVNLDLDALIQHYHASKASAEYLSGNSSEIDATLKRYNSLFEWTDGSLVQAMRSGDHFLLDEISLADDSVLERLNSVLESQRTLLLAEKGSTDALVTAAEGFQFLATMNPGGDYGKRELSPALRNRFTEIWVPALSDPEDLAAIVRGRLTGESQFLTPPIVDFAIWYTDRYSLSKSPTVSIRDLVTWIDFVNLYPGSKFGFFHGACLVYIDPIGANPAAMVAILPEKVLEEREACFRQLETLTKSRYPFKAPLLDISNEAFKIGDFSIPRVDNSDPSLLAFSFEAETTGWNTMRIVRALQLRKPILIEGNPGVGKTTLITALASVVGKPLVRINLSEQTDLMDLFGSDVPDEASSLGSFVWRDAPFLTAMQNGDWVLLDEMNLASQSVLEGLNACLDHRGEVYVSELDMTFKRHPNFVLFAAQNPHHQGGGRKGLPASFVNRFTVVYADEYSEKDMHVILNRYFPHVSDIIVKQALDFVRELHAEVTINNSWGHLGSPWEFNLRDVLRWMTLITSSKGLSGGLVLVEYLESLFKHRFRAPADISKCLSLCRKHFGGEKESRYFQLGEDFVQIGKAVLSRSPFSAGALVKSNYDFRTHLPQMESVAMCVQHGWPCILVGSSGSGKSEILKQLSAATGNKLVVFSMNSDMDATDLVGGYEQCDVSRTVEAAFSEIQSALRKQILQTLPENLAQAMRYFELYRLKPSVKAAAALAGVVQQMSEDPVLQSIFAPVKRLLNSVDSTRALRFEWVDGILVQAIQRGDWLVLDNANLCSSSVLDRLNSLLEPNGTLVLNEKRTSSGGAVVITPHRDFRLFLCMDPRYGELSRAMRNRALEVFIPNQETKDGQLRSRKSHISTSLGSYAFTQATEALRSQASSQGSDFTDALVRLLPSNLVHLSASWRRELSLGLLSSDLDEVTVASYDALQGFNRRRFGDTLDMELSAVSLERKPESFLPAQPVYILSNSPLFDRLSAHRRHLQVNTHDVAMSNGTAVNGQKLEELGGSPLSGLEYDLCNFVYRVIRHLFVDKEKVDMITELVSHVAASLCSMSQSSLTAQQFDVLELLCSYSLKMHSGLSLTIQSTGAMFLMAWANFLSVHPNLQIQLSPLLHPFERRYGLEDGMNMPFIWRALRPQTATSATEHANLVSFSILLQTLDEISQMFEYPLDELVLLRSRLLALHKSSDFAHSSTTEILAACRQTMRQISDDTTQKCSKSVLLKSCSPMFSLLRLDELKKLQKGSETSTKRPYFCKEFDYMNQYLDLAKPSHVDGDLQSLIDRNNIFGRKSGEASANAAFGGSQSGLLESLKTFTRSTRDGLLDLASLQGQLPSTLISKLAKVDQVSLGQLDLLELELDHLLKMLSNFTGLWRADLSKSIGGALKRLIKGIVSGYLDLTPFNDVDAFLAIARQGQWGEAIQQPLTDKPSSDIENFSALKWLDHKNPQMRQLLGRYQATRSYVRLRSRKSTLRISSGLSNLSSAEEKLKVSNQQSLRLKYPEDLWTVETSASLEFAEILHCSLLPALDALEDSEDNPLATLAYVCVQVAGALGDLYFPDKPFDPALNVKFQVDLFDAMEETLQRHLSAAIDVQQFYFGNSTNPYIEKLESSLAEMLSSRKQVIASLGPSIYRTQGASSALIELFSHSSKLTDISSNQRYFASSSVELVDEIVFANQNIASLSSRLNELSHAFGDLTAPAIGILSILRLGLSLRALELEATASQASTNSMLILDSIPFMAMAPPWSTEDIVSVQSNSPHARLQHDLLPSRLALLKGIEKSDSMAGVIASTALDMFTESHASWKAGRERIEREQEQASGLYRFKDPELADDEEAERTMFPLYEDDMTSEMVSAEASPKLSKQALSEASRKAAASQSAIFGDLEFTITQVLDTSAASLPLKEFNNQSFYGGNAFVGKMVPLLIQQAESARHRIVSGDEAANFYYGSNLKEARHLVVLVRDVRRHFAELATEFPENASIQDVIACCEEALAFRLSDPLAKIITKAEKLHGYIHLWQTVASLKYSAATLETRLTDLLVSWRRIELSTWGQLFDEERSRCKDQAHDWWYNVFETVFLFDGGADLEDDVLSILQTLNDFMASSSIGGYKSRHSMLDTMLLHYEAMPSPSERDRRIVSSVRVLVAYYARFISTIDSHLENGTKPLEKKIKDVILLASWKDTNIAALRDSAKRSHNKLYRAVRKYRSLLDQPVESLIRRHEPSSKSFTNGVHHKPLLSSMDDLSSISELDLAILQKMKPRSPRFVNLSETLKKMREVGALPTESFDVAAAVSSFVSGVEGGIQELRKATPQKWTEEQSDTIKRLKVQKRKLFTDTLKVFREMGFSANPPLSTLARQYGQPSIFLNSAALPDFPFKTEIDDTFFATASLLTQVREVAREHSEDLSGSEIARSVGYLQSTFNSLMRQRSNIAATLKDFDRLEETNSIIHSVAALSFRSEEVVNGSQAVSNVFTLIKWLPSLLETAARIVEIQCSHAQIRSAGVLKTLTEWRATFQQLKSDIEGLQTLPDWLDNPKEHALKSRCETQLAEFRTQLGVLEKEDDRLALVTSYLQQWDEPMVREGQVISAASDGVNELVDEKMQSACDLIFVALQSLAQVDKPRPESSETPSWLVAEETALTARLQALHVSQISKALHSLLSEKATHGVKLQPSFALRAICRLVAPVILEYSSIVATTLEALESLHLETCKMAHFMCKIFVKLGSEGFCSPKDTPKDAESKIEKLESGTGLRDGEGNEDISKDIQDDEDMEELAQQPDELNKEDMEKEDDAVDVPDEMEGGTDAQDQKGESDDEGGKNESGSEEEDMDDDVGSVDELDPDVVDEKMWDGKPEENEKELEGKDQKGSTKKDETEAGQDGEDDNEQDGEDEQTGALDDTDLQKEEDMQPHVDEGKNLDLPEQMELDESDGKGSDSEGMDDLSDIENGEGDEEEHEMDATSEQANDGEGENELEDSETEHPDLDAEDEQKQLGEETGSEPESDMKDQLQERKDDAVTDAEAAQSEVPGGGQEQMQAEADDSQKNAAERDAGVQGEGATAETEQSQQGAEGEQTSEAAQTEHSASESAYEKNVEAMRSLGNAMEQYLQNRKKIHEPAEEPKSEDTSENKIDQQNASEFEHLPSADAKHDAQALDAATSEQAGEVDESMAIDTETNQLPEDFQPDQDTGQDTAMELDQDELPGELQQEESGVKQAGAFIGEQSKLDKHLPPVDDTEPADMLDVDNHLSKINLSREVKFSKTRDEASALWQQCEARTRPLSLALTEQLRLILAPTLSSKMRGDFRTGKRLNMKRIIPYIASQYKRDKIWMRRSMPSKRNYQVLLAVDDSKSMDDGHISELAFDTLTLVSTSLSMLEVGDIGIVGFGEDTSIVHDLDTPFSSEAGVRVLQQFSFQQTRTNVQTLVKNAMELFASSKLKSSSSTDTWQLLIIISDGVCEDHPSILRLCRQAYEEKIMIVFIIVDCVSATTNSSNGTSKANSILDLTEARFEADPGDEDGRKKVKMVRYLDSFPFAYYLVVRNIVELPSVLSTALRGWFAEVAEAG